MKGFYRQRKNAKNRSSKSSKKLVHSATLGSLGNNPNAKKSSESSKKIHTATFDDYDEEEVIMRQFDMNMSYGPCIGMTRLARWERAHKLGLNPPQEIETLLRSGKVKTQCLWSGGKNSLN